MATATAVFKQVAIKREATYGVAPVATGAQLMRRTESTFNLAKDTYQSAEVRTDQQRADFRHGVRRTPGNLRGELSPGSYSDIMAAILKRDFTNGASAAAVSVTIAGTGPTYTVTRAAGSYLTDGFKLFDVIRLTVGSLNAANINKNLMITALTATVATVIVLNGVAMFAEGPITGTTVSVTGKKTFVPTSGHTDVSFSLEHWFPDVPANELFTGVKFMSADIALPPTGLSTIDFAGDGKDITTNTTRFYTTPTALSTAGIVASVNGVLVIGGTQQTAVTGVTLRIMAEYTGDPVVGANTIPGKFAGPLTVEGEFSAYFDSTTLRDLFINETEASLAVALTTNNTATADFISFVVSRIKVGGADKSDGQGGITQTFPFTALLNTAGGAGTANEQTTISIQDSLAA